MSIYTYIYMYMYIYIYIIYIYISAFLPVIIVYKISNRPSVRPPVRPPARPSVRPSVFNMVIVIVANKNIEMQCYHHRDSKQCSMTG